MFKYAEGLQNLSRQVSNKIIAIGNVFGKAPQMMERKQKPKINIWIGNKHL